MTDMKKIYIEKVVLNICSGKEQANLDKAVQLLEMLTGKTPIKTVAKKRIAQWGLRPGLPIGTKVTLRGEKAKEIVKQLLEAKENLLKPSQFDDHGNISFGIHEYIDIPDIQYVPEIGVIGLQVCITLTRPGFRIKRKRLPRKVGKPHQIKKEDSIEYLKSNYNVKILGEDENES
jgi:large subunit ribosomal protein L5